MVTSNIEVHYDPDADAANVYIVARGPGRSVARTRTCDVEFDGASISVDLKADNRILGFEILGASKVLPSELLGGGSVPRG